MSITNSFLEITLHSEEDFLKVKETLTRIGLASRKEKKLYQSCHILHKQGRYYIVHFKELFTLDGKHSDISEEDVARRNTIAGLLEEWNLVKILNVEKFTEPKAPVSEIKILSHKNKFEYELITKYTIGSKRKK
jgi:hypothetical protein